MLSLSGPVAAPQPRGLQIKLDPESSRYKFLHKFFSFNPMIEFDQGTITVTDTVYEQDLLSVDRRFKEYPEFAEFANLDQPDFRPHEPAMLALIHRDKALELDTHTKKYNYKAEIRALYYTLSKGIVSDLPLFIYDIRKENFAFLKWMFRENRAIQFETSEKGLIALVLSHEMQGVFSKALIRIKTAATHSEMAIRDMAGTPEGLRVLEAHRSEILDFFAEKEWFRDKFDELTVKLKAAYTSPQKMELSQAPVTPPPPAQGKLFQLHLDPKSARYQFLDKYFANTTIQCYEGIITTEVDTREKDALLSVDRRFNEYPEFAEFANLGQPVFSANWRDISSLIDRGSDKLDTPQKKFNFKAEIRALYYTIKRGLLFGYPHFVYPVSKENIDFLKQMFRHYPIRFEDSDKGPIALVFGRDMEIFSDALIRLNSAENGSGIVPNGPLEMKANTGVLKAVPASGSLPPSSMQSSLATVVAPPPAVVVASQPIPQVSTMPNKVAAGQSVVTPPPAAVVPQQPKLQAPSLPNKVVAGQSTVTPPPAPVVPPQPVSKLNNAKANPTSPDQVAEALKNYINRIESHQSKTGIDFAHGFKIFKKSRALNREANYLLAKRLLQRWEASKLMGKPSTVSLFKGINSQRKALIQEQQINKRPHYISRGINSAELKSILKMKV